MAERSYKDDDISQRAIAQSYYNLLQKISSAVTDSSNVGTLGYATKFGKALTSLTLDDDPEYEKEMNAVAAAYSDRPPTVPPEVWRREQRLEELECQIRSAWRCGVFHQADLKYDPDPL